MINTKNLTEQELDILLDSLDYYERTSNNYEMEYSRMRESAEMIENQLKRQINSEQELKEQGSVSEILKGINNYKKEVLQREKEAILSKKITREKITLLKAKLILLQQEKAIDSIFNK